MALLKPCIIFDPFQHSVQGVINYYQHSPIPIFQVENKNKATYLSMVKALRSLGSPVAMTEVTEGK